MPRWRQSKKRACGRLAELAEGLAAEADRSAARAYLLGDAELHALYHYEAAGYRLEASKYRQGLVERRT